MGACTVLRNAKVVTEKGVLQGGLTFDDAVIREVFAGEPAPCAGARVVDCGGRYLLPGLFDTHMHAVDLVEVIHGRFSLETLRFTEIDDAVPRVLKRLPQLGVTSCMLSSMAATDRAMERFLSGVKACGAAPDPLSARLWGVDLEGNFLKDPAYSGMQDASCVKEPDVALFDRWQDLAGGRIRKALVAPEWGEPAYRLIRHLAERGVVPSVGHTGCTRDEMMKAYEHGTRVAVHLGNGPMSQNFKGGGALDALFALGPKVWVEIIADLKHVHPHWINTFMNGFTMERVIGVSDSTQLAGAPIEEGTVIGDTVYRDGALWSTLKANTLAGSASTLDRQFGNVLNLLTGDRKAYFRADTPAPYTLEQALPLACAMYSLNPARCFALQNRIGSLAVGKAADVVVAEVAGTPGAYKVGIATVYLRGRETDD